MRKTYIILAFLFCIISGLNAQTILSDDFESGTFNTLITFQSTGSFISTPGIKNNTSFGSSNVFGFGKSTCGSSCFNNYATTLVITFPLPTYVGTITWKEMEIYGNWGSQGVVLLDDVLLAGSSLGVVPINNYTPDATPRNVIVNINRVVTTIKLAVNDITNNSEIIIDDLKIESKPQITGYEYWFNNDYTSKINTSVSPTKKLLVAQDIPTTSLINGINAFNFRTYDNYGKYSSTLSQFFYKMPQQIASVNNLTEYEYWFDNDYANSVSVTTPVQHQIAISELINAQSLINGIHIFNIRFKDNTQQRSSTLSQFFYKMPQQIASVNNLTTYEYWFDNDYANSVSVTTPIQHQIAINELINAQSLVNGIHTFNIRFKDSKQQWSSTLNQFFYKMPVQTTTTNLISNYRYWIDNNYANAVTVTLPTPVKQINVIDDIDFTQIQKGKHALSFQFKDVSNLWSVVTIDSIKKTALPISNFIYTINAKCDSTVVTFTNKSIDADKYLWNFGDTKTDSIANPTHTYYTPGLYTISLIVRDTITLANSTKQISIFITGNTSHSFSVTNCDKYISPSGLYTFTSSGIYNDTIPNQWTCDSLLTINVTINNAPGNGVTQSETTLTANAPGVNYQWLDCNNSFAPIVGATNQSFTASTNGKYAVKVSKNSCDNISTCYTITTVGIMINTYGKDIAIYPNPTKDEINLKFNLVEPNNDVSIKVLNYIGQEVGTVFEGNKESGSHVINYSLSQFATGIYFVVFTINNTDAASYKIVKE